MTTLLIFKRSIIILFALQTSLLFSQYEDFPVKEKYDQLNVPAVEEYYPCERPPNLDHKAFGDGLCHILEGYITMYETTGDKAYLYKYIIQSMCVMKNRHDYVASILPPRWDDEESMYHNGNIVASFARFVHFVKTNPALYSTPLHPFNDIVNNPFNTAFYTFGNYAEWLQSRCAETLWWFSSNGYWLSNGFRRLGETKPAEINMQVGFARAMLYIGLTSGETSFLTKASIIANQFKGHVVINDLCESVSFNSPVFQLNYDNAYQWFHKGWRVITRNCWNFNFPPAHYTNMPEFSSYIDFKEDISHGVPVTWLVNDFRKYQSATPFNLTDMVRFKNMFAKRIYAGNGNFHNAVDGMDNPIYCGDCGTNLPMNYFEFEFTPLNYMYLSDYDAWETTSPTVYEIVMNHYQNKLLNATTKPLFYQGTANKGHAEVVQAHWKRECFSLTLFNRNVVYNQDFFAKRNLVVNPSAGLGASYADPIINEQTFTVENGITANFTAGESVQLKPGTQLKIGSNVRISVSPVCTEEGSGMVVYPSGMELNQMTWEEQTAEIKYFSDENIRIKEIQKPTVSPNPFGNHFTIESLQNDVIMIQEINGKIVHEEKINIGSTVINTNNLSNGVYLIKLVNQGIQTKLVKQ